MWHRINLRSVSLQARQRLACLTTEQLELVLDALLITLEAFILAALSLFRLQYRETEGG